MFSLVSIFQINKFNLIITLFLFLKLRLYIKDNEFDFSQILVKKISDFMILYFIKKFQLILLPIIRIFYIINIMNSFFILALRVMAKKWRELKKDH